MIARRADWKRAEQSAARFQVVIAAAQCGAVSGVGMPAITVLDHHANAWAAARAGAALGPKPDRTKSHAGAAESTDCGDQGRMRVLSG